MLRRRIVDDIITELSRFSELLVIAHNSSLQYKGKSIDVRQAGSELGVRYVLEGSVRGGGDRVRVSAQLLDTLSGAHRCGYPCRACQQGRGRANGSEAAGDMAGL
jgi:TolB-like protein